MLKTVEIEPGMTLAVRECPEEGKLVTIIYDPFNIETIPELGMTLIMRGCPEEGPLVTVVYDPFVAKRMDDYHKHRQKNPVKGENLAAYADHCTKIGKPVDADVVGHSLDLYVLKEFEGLRVKNLPRLVPGFKQCGHTFYYN